MNALPANPNFHLNAEVETQSPWDKFVYIISLRFIQTLICGAVQMDVVVMSHGRFTGDERTRQSVGLTGRKMGRSGVLIYSKAAVSAADTDCGRDT